MATTPTPTLVFAELAPHALHIAIISGRKIVACQAFKPESKAEIAAFGVEHKIAGIVRASILGERIFLHLSSSNEATSIRTPVALKAHVDQLAHGFTAPPSAEVFDAATGLVPDANKNSPWLLALYDNSAFGVLSDSLGELGLAPAGTTLAAPAHLGAVAASLAAGEIAAVFIPGTDEAWLGLVTNAGVQSVVSVPLGFTQIFESVQKGLGLKFRAAAGKLFFNDTYDFGDASAKISEMLTPVLKPMLDGKGATFFHVVGLASGQIWFAHSLASALGLAPLKATGASVAERVGLDAAGADIPLGAAGLLYLMAAGSASAAWIQPTLDNLVIEARKKPEAIAPVIAPNTSTVPAMGKAAAAASGPAAPVAPAKSVAKPAAPAPAAAIKPASAPKPAPKPAVKLVPKPMPVPVLEVAVSQTPPTASAQPARKSSKAPLFMAVGVGLVASVVGLGLYFRSPNSPRAADPTPSAVATPTPAPAPAATPAPLPTPAFVATPTPVPPAASTDLVSAESNKFANNVYKFSISPKGFIKSLSTARDEVLIDSAGGISLQGSYAGSDGRKKWFNIGGVDDVSYVSTVNKTVRDGATVFDVLIRHPRFNLDQSFACLPNSIKVTAKFTPINLRDPRGAVVGVNSLRLDPASVNPSLRMRSMDNQFIYSMRSSILTIAYDAASWSRDGVGGLQSIVAGENGLSFHFTSSSEPSNNLLNYEILFGGASN